MTSESLLSLISQGSILSHVVLILLLFMSFLSWSIICYKTFSLRRALEQTKNFIDGWEQCKKKSDVQVLLKRFPNSPVSKKCEAAYQEFFFWLQQKQSLENITNGLSSVERVLRLQTGKELARHENGLSILATISNSAPFIGLLGTVIGITGSFHDISSQGATSLAVVAPGISEALLATGIGLFVAIPASIAYNVLRSRLRRLNNTMNLFTYQVLNRLSRHLSTVLNV